MKPTITFLFSLMASSLFAQNRQASFDLSGSLHGSGDLLGLGVSVEYGKYIKHRLEWTGNLTTTIHSDADEALVNSGFRQRDASYRQVTAGLQLGSQLWFASLRTASNEIKIGAGALLRYQSSNAGGGYVVYVLPGPDIAYSFYNNEKQNLLSPGYQLSVAYAHTFSKNFFIGVKASLQNDTNADIITQAGLRVGKRF